jgi:ParB-like chromosome segregation protein Spo0J
MMSDDGFAAFLADVREKGIIHPVVTWTDSKGRKWLLDGRNRAKAWKVLADEGVEMDGKLIELPEYEYHGSEEEALSYVIACNMHRRDLSSSQRAAVAIRANMLAHRYRAKADPSNPQVIEGDLAAKIAEMVGSNRTYIFRCQKILEYSPALLKQVVEGQLSIPQALAAMKAEKDAADTAENGAESLVGSRRSAGLPPQCQALAQRRQASRPLPRMYGRQESGGSREETQTAV